MLDKPLNAQGFNKRELDSLGNILLDKSMKDLKDDVTVILKQLVKYYYGDDDLLLEYLICGVPNVLAGLQRNLN